MGRNLRFGPPRHLVAVSIRDDLVEQPLRKQRHLDRVCLVRQEGREILEPFGPGGGDGQPAAAATPRQHSMAKADLRGQKAGERRVGRILRGVQNEGAVTCGLRCKDRFRP